MPTSRRCWRAARRADRAGAFPGQGDEGNERLYRFARSGRGTRPPSLVTKCVTVCIPHAGGSAIGLERGQDKANRVFFSGKRGPKITRWIGSNSSPWSWRIDQPPPGHGARDDRAGASRPLRSPPRPSWRWPGSGCRSLDSPGSMVWFLVVHRPRRRPADAKSLQARRRPPGRFRARPP